jgi:hypothetical protein
VSTDKSEFAATSNLIRPQIVPADYLQQAGDPVHRVFLAGLLVAYAVDDKHPPTLGFVWPMPQRCEITAAEIKSAPPSSHVPLLWRTSRLLAAHWSFPVEIELLLIRNCSPPALVLRPSPMSGAGSSLPTRRVVICHI